MTTQKTRREQEFEAFKKAWEEYPSQDNEGFVPDRGGFKCGWFAALEWARTTPMPDAGDEGAARGILGKARGFKIDDFSATDSQYNFELALIKDGIAHARRAQNAEVERLKKELSWHRTQHGKDLVKTVGDVHGLLVEENIQLRALLERAIRQLKYVSEGHTSDGDIECILQDYERMKGKQ